MLVEMDLDSRLRRLRLLRAWLSFPGLLVGFSFLMFVAGSLVFDPANLRWSWAVLSQPMALFWCALAVASWSLIGWRMRRLESLPAASAASR